MSMSDWTYTTNGGKRFAFLGSAILYPAEPLISDCGFVSAHIGFSYDPTTNVGDFVNQNVASPNDHIIVVGF